MTPPPCGARCWTTVVSGPVQACQTGDQTAGHPIGDECALTGKRGGAQLPCPTSQAPLGAYKKGPACHSNWLPGPSSPLGCGVSDSVIRRCLASLVCRTLPRMEVELLCRHRLFGVQEISAAEAVELWQSLRLMQAISIFRISTIKAHLPAPPTPIPDREQLRAMTPHSADDLLANL